MLVAFSGGPDSSALLQSLSALRPRRLRRLHAFHVDHGLDPDSDRRAAAALRLANRWRIDVSVEQLGAPPPPGESLEGWAREQRYSALDAAADRLGARWIATGHHADDQAETVLLRLLFGSGLRGLGAMPPIRGRLLRPLLELRRSVLTEALTSSGAKTVRDPTNRDTQVPRNRIRSVLLPEMKVREPALVEQLVSLAKAARSANHRLGAWIDDHLDLRPLDATNFGAVSGHADPAAAPAGLQSDLGAFADLPDALWPIVLGHMHQRAGIPYPASATARRELRRQVEAGGRIGCDCGSGWRWEGDPQTLRLVRATTPTPEFTYTFQAPGSFLIPELSMVLSLERGSRAPWMLRGEPDRTGIALPGHSKRVTIRNRRPGDRIQPLGSPHSRRLKDVLIDRRIPRLRRDRLPLLVIDGAIAWIPGVTVGETFRLREDSPVWIAQIRPAPPEFENPSPPRTGELQKGNEP
ncbi:MAG: tRNA lysidine(34) synthetase TilS [Acidobacteriota bacterium]